MIRLQRIGRKNDPSFRILVLPKTSGPKAGTYVDLVGSYNPKTKAFAADGDKIKAWIAKGAQVSPSLWNVLVSKGVLEGKKSSKVVKRKNLEKNVKKEEPVEVTAPVAAAPVEEAVVEEPVAGVATEEVTEEVAAEAAPEEAATPAA